MASEPQGTAAPAAASPATGRPRFDARRQQIQDAAAVLFNRHGLRDATLALVAREIGLNLKSLRYYFEKKEDLVSVAFHHSIGLYRRLAEEAASIDGFADRIRHYVRAYFALRTRIYRGQEPEFTHFGDMRSFGGTPTGDELGAAYIDMFRAARRLFRREEGWSRAARNAGAHYLLSQLLWSVVWLGNYVPEDFSRVADRLSDILLHGLAARPVTLAAAEEDVPTPFSDSERLSQESFLRAATGLINAQGYRGASVERISATLHVTKGAFYHYNETRDQLVVACFERTFGIVRQAQDRAMAAPGADGLARVVAAAWSLVTRQMRPEGALLRTSALTAVGPELRGEMERRLSLSTWRFADMLNDGLVDGSVRPCDMRIAAEAVTATVNAAEELLRWLPAGASVEAAAELYVRPLLHGLRPPAS